MRYIIRKKNVKKLFDHIVSEELFTCTHCHSKYGLETQLKSLFYLFVRLYGLVHTHTSDISISTRAKQKGKQRNEVKPAT